MTGSTGKRLNSKNHILAFGKGKEGGRALIWGKAKHLVGEV
jgi:hypothetical protein